MGQENVYFGTKPLNVGIEIPENQRAAPVFSGGPGRQQVPARIPWQATMTKGDHMAEKHHPEAPSGVQGLAGRTQ